MCSIAIVVLGCLACMSHGLEEHQTSQEINCAAFPSEEMAGSERVMLQHAQSSSTKKHTGPLSTEMSQKNMTKKGFIETISKMKKANISQPYGYGKGSGPGNGDKCNSEYGGSYSPYQAYSAEANYCCPSKCQQCGQYACMQGSPYWKGDDCCPSSSWQGCGNKQMAPCDMSKPAPIDLSDPYSLAFGPGTYYCESGSTISESGSTGLEDCKSKCTSEAACKFISFWETGGENWCRLSSACVNWWQQGHSISMYQKLGLPATPSTYAYFFSDYMPLSCGSWWNGMLSEGPSFGQVNCEERCSADPACKYISLWSTGGVNWCRLSATCDHMTMQRHSEGQITIYRKP